MSWGSCCHHKRHRMDAVTAWAERDTSKTKRTGGRAKNLIC